MERGGVQQKWDSLGNSGFHVYDVSMQKIQILYPDPQMRELRRVARDLDRPISEIVREATTEWLRRHAPPTDRGATAPTVRVGTILVEAERLREAAWDDR